jgi:hypothetical protein
MHSCDCRASSEVQCTLLLLLPDCCRTISSGKPHPRCPVVAGLDAAGAVCWFGLGVGILQETHTHCQLCDGHQRLSIGWQSSSSEVDPSFCAHASMMATTQSELMLSLHRATLHTTGAALQQTLQAGYWFWTDPMLVAWQQPLRSPVGTGWRHSMNYIRLTEGHTAARRRAQSGVNFSYLPAWAGPQQQKQQATGS